MDQVSAVTAGRQGFTLVELLVVLLIAGILLAFAVPSIVSVLAGTSLDRGGQMVADQIALARQQAVSLNEPVQVRFFQLNGATYRAIQLWQVQETINGPVYSASSRLVLLPQNIVISTNATLSPLLSADSASTGSVVPGTATLPVYGTASYVGFQFRADGTPEYTINSANNFVTIVNASASGSPPPNYFTVQVNNLNGSVSVLRP
jgi:uncharacterized protein (TIGR02596 family)